MRKHVYKIHLNPREPQMRQKHPVDESRLECNYCGKKFGRAWNMKNHVNRVHLGIRDDDGGKRVRTKKIKIENY